MKLAIAEKRRKRAMPPPVDYDDFVGILSCEEATLPALRSVAKPKNGNGGTPAGGDKSAEGWLDDPASVKLDKIRAVFLNAKTPADVQMEAALMPVCDWLEMVVKLSPKDVKVSGGIAFRHMLADMGPIDKNQYRPKAIACEYEEVAE